MNLNESTQYMEDTESIMSSKPLMDPRKNISEQLKHL